MKPEKPKATGQAAVQADEDRDMKRTVLAALFFAVRLWRDPTTSDEHRGDNAVQAKRDADALLGELEKIE